MPDLLQFRLPETALLPFGIDMFCRLTVGHLPCRHQTSCGETTGPAGTLLKAPEEKMLTLGTAGNRNRGIPNFISQMLLRRLLFL